MYKPHPRNLLLCVFCLAAAAILPVGCASTPKKEKTAEKAPVKTSASVANFPKVSFSHNTSPLGDMVRKAGEQIGGGIVLMNGLEERSSPGMDMKNVNYEDLVRKMAEAVNARYTPLTGAYFIYPDGYETLLQLNFEGRLNPRFSAMRASTAFGAKTQIYSVLAMLSRSLGITIIADNYLSEALCGELFANDAPVATILQAIFMSARIPPQEITVDSTDEYIFLASLRNPAPRSMLLSDETSLSPEQKALLNQVVDITLPPSDPNTAQTQVSVKTIPLRDALSPLTQQMNVEVAVKKTLADIPITPCVMKKVRIRTAMDLLMRQWPVASFGYEVDGTRLLIRPR